MNSPIYPAASPNHKSSSSSSGSQKPSKCLPKPTEVEVLRIRNEDLRWVIQDLEERLDLLTESYGNLKRNHSRCPSISVINDIVNKELIPILMSRGASVTNPTSVFGDNKEFLEKPVQFQPNPAATPSSSNITTNRFIPGTTLPGVQLPTTVPAVVDDQKEKENPLPLELDVYNQLCKKWFNTGVCPHGDQCQFAHGLRELRPAMRMNART